jgi:hypothetical protein
MAYVSNKTLMSSAKDSGVSLFDAVGAIAGATTIIAVGVGDTAHIFGDWAAETRRTYRMTSRANVHDHRAKVIADYTERALNRMEQEFTRNNPGQSFDRMAHFATVQASFIKVIDGE